MAMTTQIRKYGRNKAMTIRSAVPIVTLVAATIMAVSVGATCYIDHDYDCPETVQWNGFTCDWAGGERDDVTTASSGCSSFSTGPDTCKYVCDNGETEWFFPEYDPAGSKCP